MIWLALALYILGMPFVFMAPDSGERSRFDKFMSYLLWPGIGAYLIVFAIKATFKWLVEKEEEV